MTEDQLDLFLKARDSLSAAKVLMDNKFPGYAASRAYYAMFYIAEAFLEGDELAFSKHSAVIAAFGRYFAHTGKVPVEFHRYLIEAQELRETGDYGEFDAVSLNQAEELLARADKFFEVAQNLIGPIPERDKG